MSTAPAELLYVLIFGAILLVQYLMKRFGVQPEPADAVQEAPVSSNLPLASEVQALLLAHAGLAVRHEAPALAAAIPRQRSNSRSLLGDRRELQRTIVAIAMLGPCRGQEPLHDR